MEEGERADHVMVILGGRAKVCVDENGTERVLAMRGLGQLIGERAALEVSMRPATVIALEMVWALMVQTRDFAAFLSAHPRVHGIVLSQRRAGGTAPSTGYRRDSGEDSSGTGTAVSAAMIGQPHDDLMAERWARRSRSGENCTVLLTNVVEFGSRKRTDGDRQLIRSALSRMTQATTQTMPDARSEDRGDGFLTVVPPNVSTARVVGRLLTQLPHALELHNSTQRESARFKLRLAVHVGLVVTDMGVSGEAIIVAARLLEAPRFKQAIAGSTASLGVIVSPFVYETVIRHSANEREVADYSQVSVEVKESDTFAWMKLFGAPTPSSASARLTSPGSYSGVQITERLPEET